MPFQIPEEIQCSDILHGRTHTSEAVKIEGTEEWSFGHVIELNLGINNGMGKKLNLVCTDSLVVTTSN